MVACSSDRPSPTCVVNPNPVHRHSPPNGDAERHAAIVPRWRLALLVDAQNVSPSWIPKILDIASKHGEVVVRRAFGVLETGGWIEALVRHAIQPVRRAQASAGKNTAGHRTRNHCSGHAQRHADRRVLLGFERQRLRPARASSSRIRVLRRRDWGAEEWRGTRQRLRRLFVPR